jgi:hypothetical protein
MFNKITNIIFIIVFTASFLFVIGFSLFAAFKNLSLNNLNFKNFIISKINNSQLVKTQNSNNSDSHNQNFILPNFNSSIDLPLDFAEKINENLPEILSKIKVDNNKTVNDYTQEIQTVVKKFNFQNLNSNINSNLLFALVDSLINISVPQVLYTLHKELIKNYYILALSIEEFQKTSDPLKKALIYNYINEILSKNKL